MGKSSTSVGRKKAPSYGFVQFRNRQSVEDALQNKVFWSLGSKFHIKEIKERGQKNKGTKRPSKNARHFEGYTAEINLKNTNCLASSTNSLTLSTFYSELWVLPLKNYRLLDLINDRHIQNENGNIRVNIRKNKN